MRENYRNSIASIKKFPQFTTMHVIDGQAGLIICASLIFYSLTIDNILNIIILLILAGISIGMLSGDNGILKQAGNAKKQTNIAEEKEILEQATILAMGKSKYGDIDKNKLEAELSKYSGIDGTQETDEGIEVTFSSGRTYLVESDGNVELLLARPKIANSKIVNISGKEVSEPEEAEQLYIIITPSIDGGTIESLICNEGNTVEKQSDGTYKVAISKNGTYTFKIVGKINGKESISKSVPIATSSFKIKTAENTLIINSTATNDAEKSPYVNYPSSKGKILCRVIYDNNSENGLQIISVEPVRKVTLGYSDGKIDGKDYKEKAMNSYNRAIETLNEYAIDYKDTIGIASDARCVGSDPRPGHKNDESATIEKSTTNYGTVNLKNRDENYKSDTSALRAIGAFKIMNETYGKYYWLASREVGTKDFYVRIVKNDGEYSFYDLCSITSSGYVGGNSWESAFRPVFILNSGVIITGGNGTIDKPYELGL